MSNVIHVSPDAVLFEKLDRDQFDSDTMARGGAARFSVVGAILKSQGAVVRDLKNARHLKRYVINLNLAALVFSSAYGAILGMFEPGLQTAYAAAKLPIVVVGTGLLCTPTFYVFNSILGSRFTFAQTLGIVGLMVSSATLILVAFAPIAGFFTMTTTGVPFLSFLHGAIFLIAVVFGMRTLQVARKYLNYSDATQTTIHGGFLGVWLIIVILVALQMGYYLRPFMEALPAHRFYAGMRGLFLEALGTMFSR
jgi:hypothetical protein